MLHFCGDVWAVSYRDGPFFCDPSSEELEESDSSSEEVSSTSDSDSSSLSLPAAQKRDACTYASVSRRNKVINCSSRPKTYPHAAKRKSERMKLGDCTIFATLPVAAGQE